MAESLNSERAASAADIDVLRRRAAQLARVPAAQRSAESTPAVVFQLADERYAIDARVVLEVHVLRELTPLAGARPPLFGITHWRGSVLTILDLREVLGVRARGVTDLSRVIVIDSGRRPFGILADAARDVMDLEETEILPLPGGEAAARSLLRGMTDDAVLIMDTDAVVAAGRAAASHDDNTGRGG
ncbi:MAG TPA: chemotaxis protein CheW [Longimicrobiales bacterium]|nr:chemotaxis protein CheW [Longimicrobiales bacterium]